LGKQLPPYPIPAFKNCFHIRESRLIHVIISLIFASTLSANCAISFIKLIFVAKKLLAVYFINSAVSQLVIIKGVFLSLKKEYTFFMIFITFSFSFLLNPNIILSVFKKSSIAFHSLRNSGFETIEFFPFSNS